MAPKSEADDHSEFFIRNEVKRLATYVFIPSSAELLADWQLPEDAADEALLSLDGEVQQGTRRLRSSGAEGGLED